MKHYDRAELEKYHHGRMSFFAGILCRLHLLKCTECHREYMGLIDDERFLADVKKSIRKLDVPENPKSYRTICDIFGGGRSPHNHSSV